MKIIDFKFNDHVIEIIRDIDFDNFGLNVSRPGIKIITFIENLEYLKNLSEDVVSIITTEELKSKIDEKYGLIISTNPRVTYFKLLNIYNSKYNKKTYKSIIAKSARVGELSVISNENVIIGENVVIENFVTINSNTIIGDNSIIRSGARIGNEGFEYKRLNNSIFNVIHSGMTIIKENVEIKNNVCIDKAVYSWDKTEIGNNTKIDNLVYIAHGAKIGDNCLVVGSSIVGGRTSIGSNCKLGFGAIISNGLRIGDNSIIRLGAVVTKNLEKYSDVSGNFAIEHKKNIENIKKIR